jgi:dipeptidyl aminopeptidase/acylaminoacyl peptidase
MIKLALFISLVPIGFVATVSGRTRPIQLQDYYRIESVSAPAMSPDGRRVAYVRTRIIEDENKRHSEIWVITSDNATPPVQMSDPAVSATNPRWSTDGRLLAYSSGSSPNNTTVWFVRMDGKGDGKLFQIPGVTGTPVFSPDGKWIAYTRKVEPPATEVIETSKATARFKGREYDWMNFRYDGRGYLPDPRDPRATPPMELFVVAMSGGAPKQITHLDVDVVGPTWSPDGKSLAFTADLHQRDEYAYERADLWVANLDGVTGMLTKDDGWHHTSPAWSPDGQNIAVLREEGLGRVLADHRKQGSAVDVVLVPATGLKNAPRNLTANWDDLPGAPHWSVDGRSIYFEGGVKGTGHLYRVPATGGKVEPVTQGDRMVSQVSFGDDQMAYTSTSTDSPGEIYAASLSSAGGPAVSERKLSGVNDALVAEWKLGKVERIRYDSKDGTPIESWVVLPPGYDPNASTTYPLVLAIHGGPHGAYSSSFAFEEQLMAADGIIVVYTNPRGSTGYGERFRWGTWGGWGERDFEDVMGGVDTALKHYRVDPKRLGITGYSYGGFLTNWAIGQTTRFRAAVVGAGPSDWISNYGTGDIPRTKETEFLGRPWEENARAVMLAHSPVLFADRIQTPTLFLHGEADERVPISQGEEMYTALKKRRVPAKFVRYPGEFHGGWSPWDMVHRYQEEVKWWRKYLEE